MNTVEKYKHYVNISMMARVEPVVPVRGEGALLYDEQGRSYIDCFSGISVTNVGHSNPEVIKAARQQMEKFAHLCSYVYYSRPTADLAEKLARITPGRLQKTFFGSGGAEAMEGGLRLAKQFTGKTEFIALQASFHGRSYATLSITGNLSRKKRGGPYMVGCTFVPAPYCYRCVFDLRPEECSMKCAYYIEDIYRFNTWGDVAAFVAEPIMGEGGIVVAPDGYFKAVCEVLERYEILLFIDEVQTGFCRTGEMFAIEHYGVEPDIMAMAKGIANGFPLSGFIARTEIADSFAPGEHLSTFGGNPVSCAAALATIDFMEREHLAGQARRKGQWFMGKLMELKERYPIIGDVRGKGLMIGMELVSDARKTPAEESAGKIRQFCLDHGLLIGVGGVFGNVLRIQPPLVISEDELDRALGILEQALNKNLS